MATAASGRAMRSVEEWEMSRSCQSGTPSSTGTYWARTMRAMPAIRSDMIGFFLCGIAEEPFCPAPNGSASSRTSVRCPCRTSRATASQTVGDPGERGHPVSDAVAQHDLGGHGRRGQAEALARPGSPRRVDVGVGADRSGDLGDGDAGAGGAQPVPAAGHAERQVGDAVAEHGRLAVDAVGPADPQRVAVREAEVAQGGDQRAGLSSSRSVASTSWQASAVSSRSEEVMPKCT